MDADVSECARVGGVGLSRYYRARGWRTCAVGFALLACMRLRDVAIFREIDLGKLRLMGRLLIARTRKEERASGPAFSLALE